MTLKWHKVVKSTRPRYSLTTVTWSSGPNRAPEKSALRRRQNSWNDVDDRASSGRLFQTGTGVAAGERHGHPDSGSWVRRPTSPRSSQNEVAAVSRLTSETRRSAEQTSVATAVELRQDKRHHERLEYGPRHWPSNATNLAEDGDTSSCRSQDVRVDVDTKIKIPRRNTSSVKEWQLRRGPCCKVMALYQPQVRWCVPVPRWCVQHCVDGFTSSRDVFT